jgi:predicted RNA-binding Zn-ribbon protein involved in translation (DUF1610 family)
MALTHRCPNGKATKLARTGPVGTLEGVTFTCPSCGSVKSAAQIERDSDACMATMTERLVDDRTPERRNRDRERATIEFKIRVNRAMNAPTANLEAALAALR